MAYTPSYTKPYPSGYKNKPNETTPITADVMNGYDNAIVSIETYLAEGGGGSASIAYGDEDAFNEWSETAQDGEVFIRTDDNDNAGNIYDGTERVIGKWFNKNLYRKVITQNIPSTESSSYYFSIPSDITSVVNMYGYIRYLSANNGNTFNFSLNRYHAWNGENTSTWVDINNHRIGHRNTYNDSITMYCIIEYIKDGD